MSSADCEILELKLGNFKFTLAAVYNLQDYTITFFLEEKVQYLQSLNTK